MAKQIPLNCSGHTRPVVDLSFSKISSDGYFLISACKDSNAMLRKGDTGDWVGTFYGHKGAVWAATLNNDATKAATGSADYNTTLWDAVTGDKLALFQHQHIVKAVAFSSDCCQLLTGGQEKIVRCFSVNKPEADPQVIGSHDGGIKKVLLLNNNKLCLSASEDKTIRKWDLVANKEIQKVVFPNAVSDIELSEDEEVLLVTHGKTLVLLNAETLQVIKSGLMPTSFYSACMHPQKKYIVGGGEDFKLYKLNFDTFDEIDSYKGHFGPVHIVRFSPDGELYASGSEDGTVRLWQTNVGTNYGLWQSIKPG